MFFDDDDERFLNPELYQVVRRELYAISNLEVSPIYGLRNVPTHTEDGIPIRKLYVTNLPPKTTRTELFGVFTQYGFIKSCWLRMGEKGTNRAATPTYAFVTFSNPADAHKALQAPVHERMLRGRNLRISAADSWHQPTEDSAGSAHSRPGAHSTPTGDAAPHHAELPAEAVPETSSSNADAARPETSNADAASPKTSNAGAASPETSNVDAASPETSDPAAEKTSPNEDVQEVDSEPYYNILEVLNNDCLTLVLSYVPLTDLIRSERVSKGWQNMVQEHLSSIRLFKTSWWQHVPVTLTTAVLRRVLARVGGSLARLHIDHHWSALNDRTAHTIGKFCPHLEELKIVGMHTKNWNPLVYGCKNLKSLSFVSCNKLTDASLVQLVRNEGCIESLTIANNTHVTGLFLTGTKALKLASLAFYNCYSLQGTVLVAAVDTLPTLTTLKLDVCPISMWKIIPMILKKLPQLVELSLSEYMSVEDARAPQNNGEFCKSLATLKELKTLNLSRNVYITNAVLKQVARSCPQLEALNVSCCNARKSFPYPGVGDEGVSAVCRACAVLSRLDVSYLAALTDEGAAAAARCAQLEVLTARGNVALSAAPLATCLAACHYLKEVDVCGCDNVSEEVVCAAARALADRPRRLVLRLAGTAAAAQENEFPKHNLLAVNVAEDRSNPHLRPDFVDRIFDDSSDDSLDDLYEHDDFDFIGQDDELFLDDDMDDEYDDLFAFGLHAPDIVLL